MMVSESSYQTMASAATSTSTSTTMQSSEPEVVSMNGQSSLDDNLDFVVAARSAADDDAGDDDDLTTDYLNNGAHEPTDADVEIYRSYSPGGGSNSNNSNNRQSVAEAGAEHRAKFRAMGGAAVVGGVAGMLLLGPLIGLVAAGGAAVAAANAPGKVGDRVRATGEGVAQAGDKLRQMDQQHQIVEKVTLGFHKTAAFISERLEPCYNPTAMA
eukprot:CAMPEP_0198146888 /NCGR_PEP_ID=MMETSP1443-20131203/32081_1 /TAXON_ID=186043 /ORGANISM="Entomoneis sp., Strain CCMP2396" /LENGTH=212 /DNA_ID=CAMNT_0043810993 /DNA_START=51 /DNA_END=686 /DNA_ORIENTATION=+